MVVALKVNIHSVMLSSPIFLLSTGFNPVWNETLNFVVHTPELALVRFVVEDYDKASRNDFIGQFTIPFTCIQTGEPHAAECQWRLALGCIAHQVIKYIYFCCLSPRISSHTPALKGRDGHPTVLPVRPRQHLRAHEGGQCDGLKQKAFTNTYVHGLQNCMKRLNTSFKIVFSNWWIWEPPNWHDLVVA